MVADARQRDQARPAGACVPDDRRARGRQDVDAARLIAKALLHIGRVVEQSIRCGVYEYRAIAEDAISSRWIPAPKVAGVDDVREVIDASRYSAVTARFPSTSSAEVHMLSKNAFNALLKTLEAAGAWQKFPVRDDRGQQGARDGTVAVPAVRPRADLGGTAFEALRLGIARKASSPKRRR